MIRFHGQVRELLVDVEGIRPDPMNPNNGDTDAVIESILTNGVYRPIICAEDGTILAGHHLYAALLELGATKVPVLYSDAAPGSEEARRILVADNEVARLARREETRLLEILEELEATSRGITGTGVDERELERLRDLDAAPLGELKDFAGRPQELLEHKIVCPHCGTAFKRGEPYHEEDD